MLLAYNAEAAVNTNRRTKTDRRQRDYGPPRGWTERRHHAERRLPAVEEAELSAEDFTRYFGTVGTVPGNDALLERAAEVFDRVRDGY